MTMPKITHVLIAPDERRPHSVGLVIEDSEVHWGDVWGWARSEESADFAGAHARLLSELTGLELDWAAMAARLDERDWATGPGLRQGIEQAVVLALAQATGTNTAEVLSRILAVHAIPDSEDVRLILEIGNQEATTAAIEAMVALQPQGVGYRLSAGNIAESIGAEAQYLQRFVRELGMVLRDKAIADGEPALIYLGLEGALGKLTADPRRDTGRILGSCVGLETAAGTTPLWLEDPVVLDDDTSQAATMHQLHEFMQARGMSAQLIGRAHASTLDGLTLLCETDAVDGVCLRVGEWGSLSQLAAAAATLHRSGKFAVLAISVDQDLQFCLELAGALGFGYVLLGAGWGGNAAKRLGILLDRRRAWHSLRDQRSANS